MSLSIARLRISSAFLVLGLLAAPARAADPSTSAEQSVQSGAQSDAGAPANDPNGPPSVPTGDAASPSVESLPPGTAAQLPADQAAPADAGQPIAQPAEQGAPCATACDSDDDWHPFAAWRARFAATHCAPARFPCYDGQPRPVVVPGARVVAYVQAHPLLDEGCGPQAGPPEQIAEQPMRQAGPIVANDGQQVEGCQAGDGSCEAGPPAECCPGQCGTGQCCMGECGSWFGGGDYYFIRPHQTYDTAYQLTPNGATGNAIGNVNFNPTFGSAFRVFAGYQTASDESLRFSYTYIFNDTERSIAVPTASTVLTPLGATLAPGDSLNAFDHLLVNAWDIEDVRKLNFPWCDSRGCRPTWDVSWSWGVRVLQIDESVLDSVIGPDAGPFTQKSSYIGAGPRLGLDVRRHLGQSRFSTYAAANAALLVGEEKTYGPTTPAGSKGMQAIPDLDLQLGVAWQPTCRLSFTAGYLFEYFGDATTLSDAPGLALVAPAATSNLSFDGLFCRGEFRY